MLRTSTNEVGPTLLARMLALNDTQSGVLEIVFAVADDNGWLLLDLDDLRSLLGHAAEARKEIPAQYGLISTQSYGALKRAILCPIGRAVCRDRGASYVEVAGGAATIKK